MSFIGKLHEISFYGLITTIISLATHKTTIPELAEAGFHVDTIPSFFLCVLFWTSVLFIPIAVIGAFSTKYQDLGEGLSFSSNNLFIIMIAHIGEEILGIVLTPFWFLRYLFSRELTGIIIVDTATYVLEVIFFVIAYFTI